jgi:hypothetical protein
MPGLGLAVDAFDPATVLGVQAALARASAQALAAGAQQRRIILVQLCSRIARRCMPGLTQAGRSGQARQSRGRAR